MSRRFKSRATAARKFKSGTMSQFTDVGAILSSATRGDGDAGTYHEATTGEVKDGTAFGPASGYTGTYSPGGTYAEGRAAQYIVDAAAVDAVKAGIRTTVTVLGVTGTLDLSLYTLISGIVAAADVRYGVSRYTGGTTGTLVGIVGPDGTLHSSGVYAAATYYAEGIIDGTTYYASGIYDGSARTAKGIFDGTTAYDGGIFDGTTRNWRGILDGSGVYHESGVADSNTNWWATGICDGSDRYAWGTFSAGGAYNATGVIYGTGSYATEASRNNTTAGAEQIATGYSVTIAGSTTAGSATLESHTANQVLKSAGGNYNDDNLSVGNVRPVAFGLSQTGTLANLAATDTAYVNLEQSRNDIGSTTAAQILVGYSVKIRNTTTNGSLPSGSGYVYGDSDPSFVLTTATGAGTYAPIADSDTVDGGVHYGDGEEGTGMTPAEVAAAMAAAGLTLPGGSFAQTVTVTSGGTAVPNASVELLSGSVLIDRQTTNSSGVATPSANAGTYTLRVTATGYASSTTTITVTAAAARAVTLTAINVTASTVGKTTLYGNVYDKNLVGELATTVTAGINKLPSGDTGRILDGEDKSATTDANGYFEFTNCLQGATYVVVCGRHRKEVLVGTSTTQGIGSFIK